MTHPSARADLVVETVDGEVLVYDVERDRAHCLTPHATAVWRACNGARGVAEIARVTGVDDATVAQALRELGDAQLLQATPRKRKPSRRDVLVAAAVVPLVLSISVPAAAQAASCIGFMQPCTRGGRRCCAPFKCRGSKGGLVCR